MAETSHRPRRSSGSSNPLTVHQISSALVAARTIRATILVVRSQGLFEIASPKIVEEFFSITYRIIFWRSARRDLFFFRRNYFFVFEQNFKLINYSVQNPKLIFSKFKIILIQST